MALFVLLVLVSGSWHGVQFFQEPLPGPEGTARITDCVNLSQEGVPPVPVRTVFVPVPPGVSPVLTHRVTGTGTLERAVIAETDLISETAVLRGVAPLAGGVFAVIDVHPYTGGTVYASRVDLSLSWADPAGSPVAVPRGSLVEGVSPGEPVYWPLPLTRAQSPFYGRPWARLSVDETGPVRVTGAMLSAAGCAAVGHGVSTLSLRSGPGVSHGNDPADEHSLNEIPVIVNDHNGNGVFDPEDEILFFAFGLEGWLQDGEGLMYRLVHRYATHRVYWLTWGGEPGLRMEVRDGAPAGLPWDGANPHTVTREEERFWFPRFSTDTGWIWERLDGGGSVTIPYALPGIRGTPAQFTVRIGLDQTTRCDVDLYINGVFQGRQTAEGTGIRVVAFSNIFPPSSGSIRLDFETPSGRILFDRIDIQYDRQPASDGTPVFFNASGPAAMYSVDFSGGEPGAMAFDLTEPDGPALLAGGILENGVFRIGADIFPGAMLAVTNPGAFSPPDSIAPATPGRLVGTITRGDKLIVVPESLLDGVWAVAAVEERMGWQTVVATTRELYDEFGQGVADPGAIRSGVRWAMDSWDPGCREVILVGGGHYDFLNHTTGLPVMIPPWIRLTGSSEPPCVDDWYVMVHDGAFLPEIPIARLPVDTPLKLLSMVEKASLFQSGATAGSWMNRCVLLADDEWGNGNSAREAYHTEDMESLNNTVLPSDLHRVKFYLIEYPWPPGTSPDGVHPEKPEARADLIELWNRGMGALVFMGHGSINQITHEKVFRLQDVSALSNDGRLPVVILASCDLSAFDNPGVESIGEALVYAAGGGALATVGATRKTYTGPANNYGFTRVLLDSLYNSGTPSGMSVWYSKLANSSGYDSNRYYTLFGFPGLPVPRPSELPYIQISGDTLRTGEVNTVSGTAGLSSGLVLVEIMESGLSTVYNMLSGGTINYVADGGTAWRGNSLITDGSFSADCFIPVQARTGGTARAQGAAVAFSEARAGAVDPSVIVAGDPPTGDTQGPDIQMWIRGHQGETNPVITGQAVLLADLADSSGICFLGGEGRKLRLFVDGEEHDLGPYFSYNTGSTTMGRVAYTLPELSPGDHLLILQAVDGVGNPASDSLVVTASTAGETVFSQVVVYPNPGTGTRCFSFTLSGDAWVTVGVYTVAGRRITSLSAQCHVGNNQIVWDGLDADGDPPASGAYIFHMTAEAVIGGGFVRKASHTGIFAVVN